MNIKKISAIYIKVENKNNNPLLGQDKDMEMESLKKKLYEQIIKKYSFTSKTFTKSSAL